MRFLDLVRPVVNLLPEVEAPAKKQSFNDKRKPSKENV